MKKILAVISVLLCAALLFGCTPAAQSAPDGARTVTDYTGRVVSLPADVERIAEGAHCGFCTGCFTGKYPIEVPAEMPANKFDCPIPESVKNKKK